MNMSRRVANETFWSKDKKHWFCRSHIHIQSKKYLANFPKCTYGRCHGVRPAGMVIVNIATIRNLETCPAAIKELEAGKAAFMDPELGIPWCAWSDCTNDARKNSKYCSRTCSNKNAAARAKARG